MKSITVFSGAGISEESGINTFRGSNGLWGEYNINEVASIEAWNRNPNLVIEFYNERRRQLQHSSPNKAHLNIAELERQYKVNVITQNVDDLHERAGSTNVIHLHGELNKVRSSVDPSLVYDWHGDLNMSNKCEKGSPLRPHIVWFGEAIHHLEIAIEIISNSDILVVIGTSLSVFPAASLPEYAKEHCIMYYIDPSEAHFKTRRFFRHIKQKAVAGTNTLITELNQS